MPENDTNTLQHLFHGDRSEEKRHLKDVIDDLLRVEDDGQDYDLDEKMNKEFKMRASERQIESWKRAADVEGLTASRWLRQMADTRARDILVCSHPANAVIVYPWARVCTKCGTKIG